MTHDQAAVVALKALEHIAADGALLQRFLLESGTPPATLAQQAAEPEFLAGVLDFLLGDEANLLAFCQENGLAPSVPGEARRCLPGQASEFQ